LNSQVELSMDLWISKIFTNFGEHDLYLLCLPTQHRGEQSKGESL